MTPNSRTVCLYASPLIVFYATSLIIVQYIYGFNLPELWKISVSATGSVVNLSEIGLHKWETPIGHLAIMVNLGDYF